MRGMAESPDRRACRVGSVDGRSWPGRWRPEPDLYLLDEPVTGVDVTTQEDLMADPDGRSGRGPDGRSRRPTIWRVPHSTSIRSPSSTAGSSRPGRPTWSWIRRCSRRRTEATSSSCRRRRARSSTTPTTTTSPEPANATSTTSRTDHARLPHRPDGVRLHAARSGGGHPGGHRLRGHGRVRRPARARIHR